MRIPPGFLLLFVLAVADARTGAQTNPLRLLVVTQMPGPPVSALLVVDPSTGGTVPLGGFAGDSAVPYAVEWDFVNGDVLVAVQDPAGSLILRLGYASGVVVRQTALTIVPGPVSQMEVGYQGTLYVLVDGLLGGLYAVPRNGGTAAFVAALPHGTAYFDFSGFYVAWVARSPPSSDPIMTSVNLLTNTVTSVAPMLPGLTGRRITGMFEGGTALTRFLLTDDLGGAHRYGIYGTTGAAVTPWVLQPPLPPGGAVAMKQANDWYTYFLGGASSPYLRRTYFQGPNVQVVAGPLPGTPVDFAPMLMAGPATRRFGTSCNGGGTIGLTAPPQIGIASVAVTLQGALPLTSSVLALGTNDQAWGSYSLPLSMPGGCVLNTSVDLQIWGATDGQGNVTFATPIPNDPTISGLFVFGQWVQLGPTSLVTSDALSVLFGP